MQTLPAKKLCIVPLMFPDFFSQALLARRLTLRVKLLGGKHFFPYIDLL